MDETLEKKLSDAVLPWLEKCRPGWDKPHTIAVVYWMKELIKKEGGDSKVLITSAYVHDVGYYGTLKNYPYDYDEMIKQPKQDHGIKGVGIARGILERLKVYSIIEKEEILHLVEIHDELDKIKTFNELLLFEADSLGQLDLDRVPKDNFNSPEGYLKFLKDFKRKREPKFSTNSGKAYLKMILEKIPEY